MRSLSVVLSLAVVVSMLPSGVEGQEGFLACDVAPLNSACELQLAEKQVVAVFLVKPILPASGVSSPASARLSVSSDICCVDSTAAMVDPNGYAAIRWAGAAPPKTSVHIFLIGPGGRRDTVTLKPFQEPTALAITFREGDTRGSHIWLRGEFVPTTTRLQITKIGGAAIDSTRCEAIRMQFLPLVDGKATPDTGRARWHRKRRDRAECLADTRWKLGDAAGRQEMDVTIGGDNGTAARRFRMVAFGRQGPRLAAGLGVFHQIVRNKDFLCMTREDRPQCATAETLPKKVVVTERGNGTEPYFALEFPLLAYRVQEGLGTDIARRVRFVAGSTFNNPENNVFVGVSVLPIVSPTSEEIPFQISVGYTIIGPKHHYVGMSLDASGLVSSILKVLGATVGG